MYKRNDLNHPKPNDKQTPGEKAMSIFVQWAQRNDRNYFGDMVQSNLNNYISKGCTPEQAVQKLIKRAP